MLAAAVAEDGRQAAARFAKGEADPDRAVALGRADFERALRDAGGDEDAQESSVLLGDAELSLVAGLDRLEQAGDLGRLRRGGGDGDQDYAGGQRRR